MASARGWIGIVVALPDECPSLGLRLKHKGDSAELPLAYRVMLSGAGSDNAARAAQALAAQGAAGLLSWGCCAALAEHLQAGELILPDALWLDGTTLATDAALRQRWRQALEPRLAVHGGLLAQAPAIVAEPAAKRALAEQSGAIALDMESAAIAQVAHQHGLPCLALRTVVDGVDFALPSCVLDNTDGDGITRLPGLLATLARRPGQLPALLTLGRHFSAAMATLKQAANILPAVCQEKSE